MTLFKDSTNLQMPFFQYHSQNVSSVLDNDTKPMHYVQMFWMERTQNDLHLRYIPCILYRFWILRVKSI